MQALTKYDHFKIIATAAETVLWSPNIAYVQLISRWFQIENIEVELFLAKVGTTLNKLI